MKHNNVLGRGHSRKNALRFKTWFHQPVQRSIRREKRIEKARKLSPSNVHLLKPVVRCPSRRFNMKERYGRGFSLAELKAAEIHPEEAREIGIAVDLRRYNYSEEGIERNVARLREYKNSIKIYKNKEEAKKDGAVQFKGKILPLVKKSSEVQSMSLSEVVPALGACEKMNKLRDECIKRRSQKERLGVLRKFSK